MAFQPLDQSYDTIADAAATPGPVDALGRTWPEGGGVPQRIRELLGRRPTNAELAMYSVMWSEHCSYKSSKKHLKERLGAKTTDEMREHLLVGMGQNAGVVDIGDGWAVTFKVESHNHPSFVEPYQGAATGGIVRDIIAMGARPVAVMDQLRLAPRRTRTPRVWCTEWRGSTWVATATASACPTLAAKLNLIPPTRETHWSTPCVWVCFATRTFT